MSRYGVIVVNGFKVVPQAVTGLSGLMARAGQDAGTWSGQLMLYETPDVDDGTFGLVTDQLAYLRWYGQHNTKLASDLGAACATELTDVAKFYTTTDRQHAAQLERTYPEATSTPVKPEEVGYPVGVGNFSDWEDGSDDPRNPGHPYNGPAVPDIETLFQEEGWPVAFNEQLENLTALNELSGVLRALLTEIIGTDPVTAILEVVSGDWKKIFIEGIVFMDAAGSFRTIKGNVDRGRYAIQSQWDGRAASAAENWLAEYSTACGAHADYLYNAGLKIKNLAKAVYYQLVNTDTAVGVLLDLALDFGINVSPVGIAGGVKKLFQGELTEGVAQIILAWNSINALMDVIRGLVSSIMSIVHAAAGQGEVVTALFPCAPYQHPGLR